LKPRLCQRWHHCTTVRLSTKGTEALISTFPQLIFTWELPHLTHSLTKNKSFNAGYACMVFTLWLHTANGACWKAILDSFASVLLDCESIRGQLPSEDSDFRGNHFNKHTSENMCHKIKQYQRQRIALYEALTGQEKMTLIDIDPYTRMTPMHQIFNFISSLLAKSSLQKTFYPKRTSPHYRKPFYSQVLALNHVHFYYAHHG
jgi:hypothetical protein